MFTGLKFRRYEYLGAHLGSYLAEHYRGRLDDCDLIVPVPLHWSRYWQRGYNQAEAIARPLAKELGLPIASILRRRRATPAQSQLDRARRLKNMRDAFVPRKTSRGRDRHILLIDDVVTTGATLHAAALCLRRAGARQVTALTVARTPTPEEAEYLPKRDTEKQNSKTQSRVWLGSGWL